MKNALLVINIILICLVGYLYYLQFGKKGKVKEVPTTAISPSGMLEKAKVAYIDMDSLQSNYIYYKQLKSDFEKKQANANDEITGLQKKYQSRAMQLQQKAAGMNQQEQETAMQEINKMQQELQGRKQTIDNDLYNYNAKMKDQVLQKIENFLKVYNKDGKYSYIFSYEPGFMFYKDSTLNITPEVISGLNELASDKKK
ncbi:MAG: OmpH family outer membrane protein [Ginsengibacter sp.]